MTDPVILKAERLGSPVNKPELKTCRECGAEVEELKTCRCRCGYKGCPECMIEKSDYYFCHEECIEDMLKEARVKAEHSGSAEDLREYRLLREELK